MACWSCERPQGDGAFCDKCGVIQPPRQRTHFEVLELPARFDVDAGDLESRYKRLSRRLHPDRYARADARTRMFSIQHSTALNDAYRTLRDPTRRAEYLLSLSGIEINSERATGGVKVASVAPELLVEMMELGEALAEAKMEGRIDDVERMAGDLRRRREQAMREVARDFVDVGDGALDRIAERLATMRYYDRFLADAEGGRER